MDFDRKATVFALEAEVEAYGTARICNAYNDLRTRCGKAEKDVERLNWILENTKAYIMRDDDERLIVAFVPLKFSGLKPGSTIRQAIDAAIAKERTT